MDTFKIIFDTQLGDEALQLLQSGVVPHQVIVPDQPAVSVLARSAHHPMYEEADIAFGQPEVDSVLRSQRLRWLQLTSAGYTRFDTPEFRAAAKSRGLVVTNSSMVYAAPCADHVFSFMLAQARGLPAALQSRCASGTDEWNHLRYTCLPLSRQKVVLLGYGAIAVRLVELLQPFKMEITAYRRRARGDEGINIITRDGLPAALAEADHVVDILPDNADSRHFVSTAFLAAMKPGAVFYNIGRGTTVDQAALAEALHGGRLGAAWLDVTEPEPLPADHPLLRAPRCFITPHIAGGHRDERASLVRHFLENFRRFLDGSPLQDRIM